MARMRNLPDIKSQLLSPFRDLREDCTARQSQIPSGIPDVAVQGRRCDSSSPAPRRGERTGDRGPQAERHLPGPRHMQVTDGIQYPLN